MKPTDWSSGVEGTLATRNTPRSGSSARPAHSRGDQFVTRYPKASDISSPPCLLRLLPAGANRRVGLASTGKRRLVTAHPQSRRCPMPATSSQRDAGLVAERQPLAEIEFDAAPSITRLETEHVPLDCAAVIKVDIPEIEAAATLEKSSRMWPVLCSAGVG
jgi:hypothetical protein